MPANVRSVAPLGVLAVLAVWEMVSITRSGHDTGDERDWARAADIVRAEQQDGELIAFAPEWVDPVGRRYLGDRIPIDMAARADSARYGVIWELSIRGARSAATHGLSAAQVWHAGDVRVARYEQTPAQVVTDFVAAVDTARVSGKPARPPAAILTEVGFEPHRCVQVIPQAGQTAVVTFTGVRLATRLVGYVGLADVFTRRDVRDPARLDVAIGDEVVASTTVGVDSGWVRFEAATTPADAATVNVSATALGPRAVDRRVCFALEARDDS